MKKSVVTRLRTGVLAGAATLTLAGIAATPAFAGNTNPAWNLGVTPVDTSTCTNSPISQPFLSAKDSNWYSLMPGESASGITGEGWTLGGGAAITPSPLPDGQPGSAIDLPSNAWAISPAMCVNSADPTGRAIVRNVTGSEGIQFLVSYQDTKTWSDPKNAGQVHGSGTSWTLAPTVNLHPAMNYGGWQIVRFVFEAGGKTSDFQLSQFWVDPRMKT